MNSDSKTTTVFVGCDPGFTAPCICILPEGDINEPISVHFINGTKYKAYDNYSRAFNIAKEMTIWLDRVVGNVQVVLGIEGPSYGSQSSSMEQLALCRQAIYDAFEVFTDLQDWHQIAPATAKKAITGNGRAQKEDVITFARVHAPKAMAGLPTFRQVKRRTGKVEEELDTQTAAIADSLAIAIAVKRKWEGR